MKRFYWMALFTAFSCATAVAQTFSLLKDINPGSATSFPHSMSNPSGELTAVNDELYFGANDGVHGVEFWKSDGTAAGTQMVLDINPTGNSSPQAFYTWGGYTFFRANNGVQGYELWKTDGTTAGTVLVKDINIGSGSSNPNSFITFNGFLFFSATDGTNGTELWKTDGTAAGTVMVKNINTNTNAPNPPIDPGPNSNPSLFAIMRGALYFSATDGPGVYGLWKTDGTEAGTQLVKHLPISSRLVVVNQDELVFLSGSYKIWRSDGTEAGTEMIFDTGNDAIAIPNFCQVNNKVFFFTHYPAAHNIYLWQTDGTGDGTILIKTLPTTMTAYSLGSLTAYNEKALFICPDATGATGVELWMTDGTSNGTAMLKDIYPGFNNSDAVGFMVANNTVYFRATNGVNGKEIWKTDGTAAGTSMVQDIVVPGDSFPEQLTPVGQKIFVLVDNIANGKELWVANVSIALPVTLLDLGGRLSGNDGLLSWTTSSEQNTSHFELERSVNGKNFNHIATENASGNSSSARQYSYTDINISSLGSSVVYYRLKTVDVDGKSGYSKIIAININDKNAVVMLYPNPVHETATLMISVTRKEKITCRIIDLKGSVVQQREVVVEKGSNSISLETKSLPTGAYTISLHGPFTNTQVKLVRQ